MAKTTKKTDAYQTTGMIVVRDTATRIETRTDEDYAARIMGIERDALVAMLAAGPVATSDTHTAREGEPGSVVPDAFKRAYRTSGVPGSCGDSFAAWMKAETTTNAKEDGKDRTIANIPVLIAMAEENGVDYHDWIKSTDGWQGRFRMTFGNVMRPRLQKGGVMLWQGNEWRLDEKGAMRS